MDELKTFMQQLALESGAIIKQYFRRELTIDLKSDASPVTIADKKAEEKIRRLIETHYPQHGIIGEEWGEVRPKADYQWVVDPIDGTKSFISGSFDFGTIIGLLHKGEPVLGMIHQPVLGELLIGDNRQTTCNGIPVHCRDTLALNEATLLTTDFYKAKDDACWPAFHQLTQEVKLARTWGNTFGYSLVAMGYADIMVDLAAAAWDFMGAIPVVRGAGGVMSNLQGDSPEGSTAVVACVPGLQEALIKRLNRL